MRSHLYSRWPVATALFLASCSQGSPTSPVTPSSANSARPVVEGTAGAHAEGDTKVGSGALEIVRLRMDRQTAAGTSVLRQYANPGGRYAFSVGETIELWAEYPPEVANPRLIVEWGDGVVDHIGCGSCLIKHTYTKPGPFTVRVTLDDRVSTTATRVFTLDGAPVAGVASVTFSASFPGNAYAQWNAFEQAINPAVVYDQVDFSSNLSPGYSCTGAAANQICQAIRNQTNEACTTLAPPIISCGGNNWQVGVCGGTQVTVNSPSWCNCAETTAIRPEIRQVCGNTTTDGNVNGPTCASAAVTMTVTCR